MTTQKKIKSLITAGLVMASGLILFKFIPMHIWGRDILFDASLHLTATIFALYILWYFIDQNKKWRMPFLAISLIIIFVVSTQRIIEYAHNDIGLLLGLAISVFAIAVSRPDYFKGKFDF